MSTQLAVLQPAVLQPVDTEILPSPQQWQTMLLMADTLVRSGFLPRTIDTPAKAAAVILKGRELGIPAMQSFAHIYIIEGKPSCSSELQLALLARGGVTWEWRESSATAAEIVFTRQGFPPFASRFDLEDAKRALLLGKNTWKLYPANMLRARAIANGARMIGPDLLAGMSYTPEELGAEVDEEGDVVEAPTKAVETVQTEYGTVDTNTGEIVEPEPSQAPEQAPDDTPITEAAILLRLDWPGEQTETVLSQAIERGGETGLNLLRDYHRMQFTALCGEIRTFEPEVYPHLVAVANARKKYVNGKQDDTLWKAKADLPALKAYRQHISDKLDSIEGGEKTAISRHRAFSAVPGRR